MVGARGLLYTCRGHTIDVPVIITRARPCVTRPCTRVLRVFGGLLDEQHFPILGKRPFVIGNDCFQDIRVDANLVH